MHTPCAQQDAKPQAESLAIQNQAAEIKLRAERRAGELLKPIPKQHGARPADTGLHDATPASLEDNGACFLCMGSNVRLFLIH